MTSTSKLADYLGRWLSNAIPGTGNAADWLGRGVTAGDKDFLGVSLGVNNPAVWVKSTAYTAGSYVRGGGNQLLLCTVSGTSGSGSEPIWGGVYGAPVTDGTAHFVRVH